LVSRRAFIPKLILKTTFTFTDASDPGAPVAAAREGTHGI
jgi:hypothetical protein